MTSLWTVSMAATHGEAAHRSVTACASSGWLFPERRVEKVEIGEAERKTNQRGF